jgi:hypothetical protein
LVTLLAIAVLHSAPHHRLAEKIRQARVNKERALQVREKEELARQEAEYHRRYDQVCVWGGGAWRRGWRLPVLKR